MLIKGQIHRSKTWSKTEGRRKMIPLWRVQKGRIMSDGIRFEVFRKFRKTLRAVKNSHSNQWSLKIFGKKTTEHFSENSPGGKWSALQTVGKWRSVCLRDSRRSTARQNSDFTPLCVPLQLKHARSAAQTGNAVLPQALQVICGPQHSSLAVSLFPNEYNNEESEAL